jgi:hypothetical protein
MSGYILNDSKTFEIFVRTEKALKNGMFPIMTRFAEDEIDFIIKVAKTHLEKKGKIIEMGVGSGRVIKELSELGFLSCGFDNDHFFVEYCKSHSFDVFLSDATKPVSRENKHKYKMAVITFNTLFNFSENIRIKWISHAYELLDKDGFLVIVVYSSENIQKSVVRKRVKFYQYVLDPPNGYRIEFFDSENERGICMLDGNDSVQWFSLWRTEEELKKETSSWKGFDLIRITQLDCKIAFGIVLQKVR